MIQRIQSIYLLFAGVVNGILIFLFPLYLINGEPHTILEDPAFLVMTVLSTLISLFSIFRYRNRQQQVVAGRINIILNFVMLGLMLFYYFARKEEVAVVFHVGLFLPLLSVILISMANRAIFKDESIIRSADRLR